MSSWLKGLARELVAVVPHLVLDVGELRVVLVVLLVLRAVDCRVERLFHAVSDLWRNCPFGGDTTIASWRKQMQLMEFSSGHRILK